jgi:cell division protein ZapA (FtsZ GTPase activity inhibitor)
MPQDGLRIDLLGTSFTIKADKDQAYLRKLLDRYKRSVEEVRAGTGIVDPLKIAIVAGISLCDEIEKNRTNTGLFDGAETERIALELIARIDEAVKDQRLD